MLKYHVNVPWYFRWSTIVDKSRKMSTLNRKVERPICNVDKNLCFSRFWLQRCISWWRWRELTLLINIKKTVVTDQDVYRTPNTSIDDYILGLMDEFLLLAARALARLGKRNGTTPCWPQTPNAVVNLAYICVLDTLLFVCGPCTPSKSADEAPTSWLSQ